MYIWKRLFFPEYVRTLNDTIFGSARRKVQICLIATDINFEGEWAYKRPKNMYLFFSEKPNFHLGK